MDMPRKADPALYAQLRRNALEMHLPNMADDAVQSVLMDWHLDHRTVTAMAAADGNASLYLSTGGGFLGGSPRYPTIRAAALHAVALANGLLSLFEPTTTSALPSLGDVTFYVTTNAGLHVAVASQTRLRSGTDPLAGLGGAMQKIVTEYRLQLGKRTPPPDTLL